MYPFSPSVVLKRQFESATESVPDIYCRIHDHTFRYKAIDESIVFCFGSSAPSNVATAEVLDLIKAKISGLLGGRLIQMCKNEFPVLLSLLNTGEHQVRGDAGIEFDCIDASVRIFPNRRAQALSIAVPFCHLRPDPTGPIKSESTTQNPWTDGFARSVCFALGQNPIEVVSDIPNRRHASSEKSRSRVHRVMHVRVDQSRDNCAAWKRYQVVRTRNVGGTEEAGNLPAFY
jgi:hypothetical protein